MSCVTTRYSGIRDLARDRPLSIRKCCANDTRRGCANAACSKRSRLIKTLVVKNRRLVAKLQEDFSMARGEAKAIALALDEKAQFLGIDDKNGIHA